MPAITHNFNFDITYVFFLLIGYLSGSILYARIFGYLFKHKDITQNTKDNNPGTANAFINGGFFCGICTLVCDLLKGFVPVFIYLRYEYSPDMGELALAFIFIMPVLGHMFPVFHRFNGGKAIAVSFGSLLGGFPYIYPALVLAFFFILFSVIIRISPHYYRTIGTYACTALYFIFTKEKLAIKLAVIFITLLINLKLLHSNEEREQFKVNLLWMH